MANRFIVSLFMFVILSFVASCSDNNDITDGTGGTDLGGGGELSADSEPTGTLIPDNQDPTYVLDFDTFIEENKSTHEESGDDSYSVDGATTINLADASTAIDGSGATYADGGVSITAAGTYIISGTLTDGSVVINTDDADAVKVVLNGATISCSDQSPLAAIAVEKFLVFIADGTNNVLTDGTDYVFADGEDEPNAALYSKGDMTIMGEGSLTVNANYNDGIASKDGLVLNADDVTVNAADDGIRGKDYLVVNGGSYAVTAGGDGLKSDNDEQPKRGYIHILDGALQITSTGDGMQAETDLIIEGGDIDVTSGGGYTNTAYSDDDSSAKGLKTNTNLLIDKASITLNSADDAMKSDTLVCINGGTFEISSLSDGIQSEITLYLNDGDVNINNAEEGIEAKDLYINGGNTVVFATDDALNASNGEYTGDDESSDGSTLIFNAGFMACYTTSNDAIDSNGDIIMNGGTVISHGPATEMEQGLDATGNVYFNGGLFITTEMNSHMRITPSTGSQNVLVYGFESVQSADLLNIQNEAGESLFTFKPLNTFNTITITSPDLQTGSTYTIYVGGSHTGTATEGLYGDGIYSGGTSVVSLTLDSKVTVLGESITTGGGPGGGFPGGPM